MVISRPVRIHESLIDEFGKIGKPIAEQIKKDYGLKTITLDYPTISQLVAGKLQKKKSFNFKIKKVSRDKGILTLF